MVVAPEDTWTPGVKRGRRLGEGESRGMWGLSTIILLIGRGEVGALAVLGARGTKGFDTKLTWGSWSDS